MVQSLHVMKPPTTIATRRLLIRPPHLDDAEAIFARYAQDREVTQYLIWRPHTHIDETRDFLRRCITVWEQETAFPWVITQKEDSQLLGMIELRLAGHAADLGYVVARANWGQGIATEATQALVEWSLTQPDIYRVWAVCDVENLASARVLEKAGLEREGRLRRWSMHPNISPEPRDCWCYAKVK